MSGKKMKKAKRRLRPGALLLFCLFCAVFLFSGFMLLSDIIKNKAAADAYRQLRAEMESAAAQKEQTETPIPSLQKPSAEMQALFSIDFAALQEINPEIVGWIKGAGANIDYPILRAEDNSYYLDHMYNRENNKSGAIFMDYRCSGDFSDKNTVIYGHHMKNGTMFGGLDRYRDQAFYEANPTLLLATPEQDYSIELICGTVENGDRQFFRLQFENDEAFFTYLDDLKKRSTFTSDVKIQADDQIITLCTCSYERDNARYAVVGRLVPLGETPAAGYVGI
ncbi:MAG: class B sortase [Firmicutes bacterium]|nr:class B sortase [Bacillota bacterium]